MNLFELYQEEPGSSFTNDNKDYDLNKVLKDVDSYPKVMFFTKDLKWVLKYDKTDPKRVEKANLSAPILVTYYKDKFVVIDGLHRLTKAVNEDEKYIIGKVVPYEILDKDEITEMHTLKQTLAAPTMVNTRAVLPPTIPGT